MRRVAVLYRFEEKSMPYMDAVRDAGADPIGVTPEQSLESLDGLAGFVLTGGTDVDPALYGQAPGPHTEKPDPERDQMEQRLLREALDRDLPVLAICRGMQFFNVFHGGTLLQHIEGHAVRLDDRSLPVHAVTVAPDTMLARITGAGRLEVNSRHHQAVDRVGEGLVVVARSVPDGLIEGLERPVKRFALAVEWHPEDQIRNSPPQQALFCAFATAL
ncbi:MAG TPA: gamma-glutamyl-gamma-aminobutyrate hydrolase family protein [Bryobacteraceae bacterium]|nr:gamma-glutamyl-gamma-aminobutyrate hydrolase family protein [Bryobacteraceae bacterium]